MNLRQSSPGRPSNKGLPALGSATSQVHEASRVVWPRPEDDARGSPGRPGEAGRTPGWTDLESDVQGEIAGPLRRRAPSRKQTVPPWGAPPNASGKNILGLSEVY